MTEHEAFFRYVQAYVTATPEAGAYVSDYVARGIEASRQSALQRAADMEAALAVMLARRTGGRDEFVLEILRKWNGAASLRWDDVIRVLEAKVQP